MGVAVPCDDGERYQRVALDLRGLRHLLRRLCLLLLQCQGFRGCEGKLNVLCLKAVHAVLGQFRGQGLEFHCLGGPRCRVRRRHRRRSGCAHGYGAFLLRICALLLERSHANESLPLRREPFGGLCYLLVVKVPRLGVAGKSGGKGHGRSPDEKHALSEHTQTHRQRADNSTQEFQRPGQQGDSPRVPYVLRELGEQALQALPCRDKTFGLAPHLLQRLRQRGEHISGGEVPCLHEFDEVGFCDAEALCHETQRARKTVTKLLAKFFHAHHALGRHLRQGVERTRRCLGPQTEICGRLDHRLEQFVGLRHRHVGAVHRRREPHELCAQAAERHAGSRGRLPQEVDLRRGGPGVLVYRVQATAHLVHLDDGYDELSPHLLDALHQGADSVGNQVPDGDLPHRVLEQLRRFVTHGERAVQLPHLPFKEFDLGFPCRERPAQCSAGRAAGCGHRSHGGAHVGNLKLQVLRGADAQRLERGVDAAGGLRGGVCRLLDLGLGLGKRSFPEAHVLGSLHELARIFGLLFERPEGYEFALRGGENLRLARQALGRLCCRDQFVGFALPCGVGRRRRLFGLLVFFRGARSVALGEHLGLQRRFPLRKQGQHALLLDGKQAVGFCRVLNSGRPLSCRCHRLVERRYQPTFGVRDVVRRDTQFLSGFR